MWCTHWFKMAAGPLVGCSLAVWWGCRFELVSGRESSDKRVFRKRWLTVATPEAAETKTVFFDRPSTNTMTTEKRWSEDVNRVSFFLTVDHNVNTSPALLPWWCRNPPPRCWTLVFSSAAKVVQPSAACISVTFVVVNSVVLPSDHWDNEELSLQSRVHKSLMLFILKQRIHHYVEVQMVNVLFSPLFCSL